MICCNDGKEGLEKLATELPDLVLTDVMLPYVSGLEIVNAVKSSPKNQLKSSCSLPWDRRRLCRKLLTLEPMTISLNPLA